MALLEKVFVFHQKYKVFIILFWILTSGFCAYWALGLLNATIWILNPPKGYPSYTAYNKMNEFFPALLNADQEIVVISLKPHSAFAQIDNNVTAHLCNDLNQSIYALHNDIVASLQYVYAYTSEDISPLIIANVIKPQFIDPAGTLMIFIISLNVAGVSTERVSSFLTDTKHILSNLTAHNRTYSANFELELTGMMTLIEDCIAVLTADIISKDLYLVPLIFVFMIWVIGSYKLVLLPFVCFAMVVCISFTVFRVIAEHAWMTVPPENPSFMLFVSMAICVDYGMFLLTRFITALQIKHLSFEASVADMLQYSGHVIVLSGSILILLEIGFGLFFPYGGLNAAGYGIAFCVFLSIVISISFTTALILLFPHFFSDIAMVPPWLFCQCCCAKKRRAIAQRRAKAINETPNNGSPMLGKVLGSVNSTHNTVTSVRESVTQGLGYENENKENVYFRLAQIVTVWPWKCIAPLLIYALMADAYDKLVTNFNPGLMQPLYVLLLPRNETFSALISRARI